MTHQIQGFRRTGRSTRLVQYCIDYGIDNPDEGIAIIAIICVNHLQTENIGKLIMEATQRRTGKTPNIVAMTQQTAARYRGGRGPTVVVAVDNWDGFHVDEQLALARHHRIIAVTIERAPRIARIVPHNDGTIYHFQPTYVSSPWG